MNKVTLALQSRTFWTIVVMVLLNVIPAIRDYLPLGLSDLLNTILGLLATFFHLNPSQNYTAPTPPAVPVA